jgi:DNA-binding phage protein
MVGIQEHEEKGEIEMPLTRDFNETVKARAKSDPVFRKALLSEALNAMLDGELAVGKSLFRDYINGTDGFSALSQSTHIPPKSLMRMFSPAGNPKADNLFQVIGALQKQEGVQLHVAAQRKATKRSSGRRRAA